MYFFIFWSCMVINIFLQGGIKLEEIDGGLFRSKLDWKTDFENFRYSYRYVSISDEDMEEEEFRWMSNRLNKYEEMLRDKNDNI